MPKRLGAKHKKARRIKIAEKQAGVTSKPHKVAFERSEKAKLKKAHRAC
jgi:hypothetical protein